MTCVAFGVPLCHGFYLSFWMFGAMDGPWTTLFFVLLLLGYVTAGLVCVGIGVARAWEGRWGAVLPCTIVPATIAMFVAFPHTCGDVAGAADYIHLAAFSVRYERAVNAASRADGPRLLWFVWNKFLGTSVAEDFVSLVYDESDEFALPNPQRSDAWKIHAGRAFMTATRNVAAPSMPDEARHLVGHYYVVRAGY